MQEFSILNDSRFLLALAGVAWTALFALAKKNAADMEKKMDNAARDAADIKNRLGQIVRESEERTERKLRESNDESREAMRDLAKRIDDVATGRRADIENVARESAERVEDLRKSAVSQHEFRLLAANLQAMVEAIYNHINQHGAKY